MAAEETPSKEEAQMPCLPPQDESDICGEERPIHVCARGRFGNAWKRKKWVFGLTGVKAKQKKARVKTC
ncbi:hypothetical protein AMECASPLE_028311 [Ameca splendens]|uniref:Uncharacterized protein n=1 Tax=Ameca splendens TaxID=208324 RepID=A0ABV0ZRM7_9TELE